MRKLDAIALSPPLPNIRLDQGVRSSITSADPSSPYAPHEPSRLRIVTNANNDPVPQNFYRPAKKCFRLPTFGEKTPLNCNLPMACPAPSGGQLAEAQPLHPRNARDQGSRAAKPPRPPSKALPMPARTLAPSIQVARRLVCNAHVQTTDALRSVVTSMATVRSMLGSDDPMME